MSARAWFGARTMVWLLLWVIVSGTVLMVWFETDAQRHAGRLGALGTLVRTVHAGTTVLLVVGALLHVAVRIRRRPTRAGLWSGAALWAALSVALWSGWLMSQTWVQAQMRQTIPVSVAAAGVVHVAYASILVVVALGLHVQRWGWHRIFAPGRPLVGSVLLLGVAVLLPVAAPGDGRRWQGVTAWSALPVAGGWLWPLALAVVLGLVAWRTRA